MNSKIQWQSEALSRNHQRRKHWYTALVVMAAVVVFCTTYALILPAITMEKETFCGLDEHTHTDECYTYYNEIKELVCELSEHEHADGCYEEGLLTEATDTEKIAEIAKTPEVSGDNVNSDNSENLQLSEPVETQDTADSPVSIENNGGAIAVQLSGEQGGTSGNLTWVLSDDGKLTISGSGSIGGYSSTGSPWYAYKDTITSVVIEDGVTSIGHYAFNECSALTEITVTSDVTTIGNYAFQKCSSLAKINLPSSLKSIGQGAFHTCSSLTSVTIPATVTTISGGAFQNCTQLSSVTFEDGILLNSLGTYVFYGCSSLEKIAIPSGVKSIGEYSFYGCTSLVEVTLPTGLTSIGNRVFSGCTSLTEVTIPAGVTALNEFIFDGCSSLKTVTFAEGSVLTSIGNYAFRNCSVLAEISIPEDVTSIITNAFSNCSSLTEIELPEGLTSMGQYVFTNCTSLAKVTLPSTLTSIGYGAFNSCSLLEEITIPAGVVTLPGGTFNQCTNLKTVKFAEGSTLTTIGGQDFQYCAALTEIEIPSTVTSIGGAAFSGCRSLEKITLPSGLTTITDNTFMNCSSLSQITIPDNVTAIGGAAFQNCTSLTEITIPKGVTKLNNYSFDGCTNLQTVTFEEGSVLETISASSFRNCGSLENIMIPSSVTAIGSNVFQNCTSLTEIAIPKGVTTLWNDVFSGCTSLVTVTIPSDSVMTSMGKRVFSGCSSLTEIAIPAGVTSIGEGTFYNCTNLKTVTFGENSALTTLGTYVFQNCSSLESIIIPKGVTGIPNTTFYACQNLKSVTFEEGSVCTSIGNNAFKMCSSLIGIVIPDGVASIGSEAFRDCTSLSGVTLPESLTVLNTHVFRGSGVKNITIPKSVTKISDWAFMDCKSLEYVTFDEGSALETIGTSAFQSCISLKEIAFPRGLTNILDNAFKSCSKLVSVTFEEGSKLTSVGTQAFYACSSLPKIDIPSGVTTIGNHVFDCCYSLKEISLPATLTGIPYRAFCNCQKLETVTFEEGSVLTSIGQEAFLYCYLLENFTIPSGVTSIGSSAFRACKALTEITIPAGVTVLNDLTFDGCAMLQKVEFAEGTSLTSIGGSAFRSCTSLLEITIPSGVTFLGGEAFKNCSMLKEITIPSAVTTIKGNCFRGCRSLKNVYFEKNSQLETVNTNAFNTLLDNHSPLGNVYRLSAAAAIATDAFSGGEYLIEINNNCADITLENVSSAFEAMNISGIVVADGAEKVNASLLEHFASMKAAYLYFDPGAHFTLVGDFSVANSRYPTLKAGEYIAGENGELYRISDGKAYFAYCPPNLQSITIPAKVGDYDIVGVDSFSFTAATELTDVTFASSESITTVSSFAFANAINLERVNDKNVDTEIMSTLSNADFGTMVFYNTKITTSESELNPTSEALHYGDDTVESSYLIINTVNNNPAEDAVLQESDTDYDERFDYTFYTGQNALTTIDISQPVAVGCSYDIYFWSLNDNATLNYSPGQYELASSSAEESSSITMTVEKLNYNGLYRISIPALKEGYTLSVSVISTATSPATSGDKMLVWGELVDSENTSHSEITEIPSQYQLLEWRTKRSTVNLTASLQGTNKLIGDGTGGDVFVNDFKQVISSTVKTVAPTSVGKDLITSVDYSSVIELPEGMYLNPDVVEALNAGNWEVKQPTKSDQTGIIYAKYDDGTLKAVASLLDSVKGDAYYPTITNVSVVDGKLCIEWNHLSPSSRTLAETGAITGSELGNVSATLTISNNVLMLTDAALRSATDDTRFTVTADVTQTVHYMHSSDVTSTSQISSSLAVGKANFTLSKSKIWASMVMGEVCYYTITASNSGTLEYEGFRYITDDLPQYLYTSAANLETMFFTENYGENLTVTITGAELCTPLSGENAEPVTGSDGNEYNLTIGNTAMDNEYSGMEKNVPSEGIIGHGDCTNDNTITLKRDGDKVSIVVKDKNSEVISSDTYEAGEIATAFEKIGFIVTDNARYSVCWYMPDEILESNETLTYYVRSTIMNSFMVISEDKHKVWYQNSSTTGISINKNTAYAYGEDYGTDTDADSIKSASCNSFTAANDAAMYSYVTVNGKKSSGQNISVSVNNVIPYSVDVTYKYRTYDVLPLVTHVSGAQVVLASYEDNLDCEWAANAEVYVSESGKKYFALNKEGTYENVKLGDYIADRVVVKETASGLDTMVYRYLTDKNMTNKAVTFDTVSSPILAGLAEQGNTYSISIESWVGDHEHHRLWDPLGIFATNVKFDKKIVTQKGDIPENDELENTSFVREGDEITYRFSFIPQGIPFERTYTKYDLYDALPLNVDGYKWSKSNISDIQFVKADGTPYETVTVVEKDETTGENTEVEKDALVDENNWSVTDTYPLVNEEGNEEQSEVIANQQYITWDDDFKFILYDEPVYAYVTLTYPSGSDWSEYCDANYDEELSNTLNMMGDFHSVYHELAVTAEVALNKGVVETGYYSSSASNYTYAVYSDTSENNRLYYANDDMYKREVQYYISLYNDGQSKLYINEIEDILPSGFTYMGMASSYTTTGGVGNFSGNPISNASYYNSLVEITPSDGSTVTYKQAKIDGAVVEDNDDKEHILFIVTQSSTTDSKSISYDEDKNMCFLYPGEALVISFYCNTNTAAVTPESAENNVAMRYYDYNGMGVSLSDATVTGKDKTGYTTNKNDGKALLYDFSEAKTLGFSGGNAASKWLGSNVTVKRGEILPGIMKNVESVINTNGENTGSTDYASFTDMVTWKVTAVNEGDYPLVDYTISDVMQVPFRFTGTVTMSLSYPGSQDISDFKLLIFGDWASDGSSVTVKTSETGTSSTITVNGDWVTLTHAAVSTGTRGAFSFDVRIKHDDTTNNYTLDFRMNSEKLSIPEGGSLILHIPTEFAQGSAMENKVYYNTCYITLNTQTYDGDMVTKGNNVTYNDMPSVRNSAQIPVTYGNATTSYKTVEETDNPNNYATSNQDKNYIIVDEEEKNITYTMTVNSSLTSLTSLLMIDSLPEVGDHGTFLEDDYRFSEFKVNLADDPNFRVTITYKDGNVKTLDSSQYTVQFSNKTSFGTDDWNGSGTDWYSLSDVPTGVEIRSFRVIIEESTGELMQSGADISVKFDAVIDGDPNPEEFAWNSFGYHYLSKGSSVYQEAAPLKVGVGMPSIPNIQKVLKDDVGESWVAEEDTKFRFLVYEGSAITGLSELTDESKIAALLEDNEVEYTYIETEVESGKSESDKVMIDTKAYSYSTLLGWSEGVDKFKWKNGQRYTVIELPTGDDYSYDNIGGLSGNTYTFTYQNDKPTYITATNRRNLWELSVLKTDDENVALAGGVFGLYSPNESDKLTDNEYNELVTNNLLTENPATELVQGIKTYYLKDIATTNENGIIIWNTLSEDDYILVELQAPSGYLKDDTQRKIERGEYFKAVTVQVVNQPLRYELPNSGGNELYVYISGGVLTLLSMLLLYRKLKRRKEEIFS